MFNHFRANMIISQEFSKGMDFSLTKFSVTIRMKEKVFSSSAFPYPSDVLKRIGKIPIKFCPTSVLCQTYLHLCKKILGKCIHIYPLEYIYCALSSLFANIRLNLLCSAPKKNNLLRYWQGNFTRLSTSMA